MHHVITKTACYGQTRFDIFQPRILSSLVQYRHISRNSAIARGLRSSLRDNPERGPSWETSFSRRPTEDKRDGASRPRSPPSFVPSLPGNRRNNSALRGEIKSKLSRPRLDRAGRGEIQHRPISAGLPQSNRKFDTEGLSDPKWRTARQHGASTSISYPDKVARQRRLQTRGEEREYGQDKSRSKMSERRTHNHNVDASDPASRRSRDGHEGISDAIPITRTTADSEFVTGERVVEAVLKIGRRRLYKLYISERSKSSMGALMQRAKQHDVECTRVAPERLRALNLTGFDEDVHPKARPIPAVVLETSRAPAPTIVCLKDYRRASGHKPASFDFERSTQSSEDARVDGHFTSLRYSSHGWRKPFLLWLHGITNVGNLGAIYRSAVFYGVDGIILSTRGTAKITGDSIRTSAGATEVIPTILVDDPKKFIEQSHKSQWVFFASTPPDESGRTTVMGDLANRHILRQKACVLILGNEELGLPSWLTNLADQRVTLASNASAQEYSDIDSLNVSAAATLFCEAFLRQPDEAKTVRSRESNRLEDLDTHVSNSALFPGHSRRKPSVHSNM